MSKSLSLSELSDLRAKVVKLANWSLHRLSACFRPAKEVGFSHTALHNGLKCEPIVTHRGSALTASARAPQRPIRRLFFNKTMAVVAVIFLSALGTVIAALLFRLTVPKSQIIVSPFEILAISSDQKTGIQNSKALADLVVDSLHTILEQAANFSGNTYASKRFRTPIPQMPHIPVETSYGIEIKGISVDQLMATWNHLRFHEYLVSGDLVSDTSGKQKLVLRYNTNDRAGSFSKDLAVDDSATLENVVSDLSLRLIKEINPDIAARYVIAEAMHVCSENCEVEWKSAIEFCWEWVKKSPDSAMAFYFLGYALAHTEHPTDALAFLDRAVQLNKELDFALNAKGYILMDDINYQDAASIFKAALKIRETPNPLPNLGTIAVRKGHYQEAEGYYKEALAHDPRDVGAYLNLGRVHLFLSRNSDAAQADREVLYLDPGNDTAIRDLALSLARDGKTTEALQLCEQTARLEPNATTPHIAKGIVLLQTRQTDLAIQHFKNFEDYNHSSVFSYYLGMAYLQRGDLDLAREQLKHTLYAYPHSSYVPNIHNLMAKILKVQGDIKGSQSEAEEAARLDPWLKNDSLDELLPIFSPIVNSSHTPVQIGADSHRLSK